MKSGYLAVRAKVNNEVCYVIVDTGAACLHLDPKRTERIQLQWEQFALTDRLNQEPTHNWQQFCRMSSFELGPLREAKVLSGAHDMTDFNRALAAHGDPPIDGVIGGQILAKYRAVLSYGSGELYLLVHDNQTPSTP